MDKFGPAGITALIHHLTIAYVYPCYNFYVDDDVPLTLPEINYLMSYVSQNSLAKRIKRKKYEKVEEDKEEKRREEKKRIRKV